MSDTQAPPAAIRNFALLSGQSPGRSRLPTLEPTLGRINDRFSRFLRGALLQHLRRGVEVVAAPIELVKHRDVLERLETPTHITLVNMKPLHGTIVLLLDLQLVVAIVESRFRRKQPLSRRAPRTGISPVRAEIRCAG